MMDYQKIINEFFLEDGVVQENNSIKKSVLISLEKDIAFCILLPRIWISNQNSIGLNNFQYDKLQKILPTFTVISQFCSAVDVLTRVINKKQPPIGKNQSYFRSCAENWFELSNEESKELWNLRNGISHSYKLENQQSAIQYGYTKIIRKSQIGKWEFYLHAMYSSLKKAKTKIYDHLSSESHSDKMNTANYLECNGFFYINQ